MSIIVNNTDNQLNINSNGVLDVYAIKSIKSVSKGVDNTGNYYITINFIANDKNNSLRIYLKDVTSPVTWTNNLTGANAALADLRNWLSEIVDVNIVGGVTLDVNLDANNDEVSIYGSNGGTPTAVAVNGSGSVAVQDGGGSLTVDGTVAATQSGAWSVTNLANSGVDIGDVTINNASGASAVNIQDGGNSITVDAVNLDIRNLSQLIDTVKIYGSNNANPVSTDVAGNIGIWDGNNSITVDGGTGSLRTTGMIRPAGGAATNLNLTVPAFYSVSVANVGSANGTVLGATIKPGEVLNFSADAINNYFNSFAYNASGTEFIIIFVY
jgi:hypothetical protein